MVTSGSVTAPQGFDAFGEWFSEVFRLWSSQLGVWLLQGLIYFAVAVLPGIVAYFVFVFSLIASSARQPGGEPNPATIFGAMGIFYGVLFVGIALSFMLVPGMVRTALKQMRGQQISVGDIFSGMRFGWGTFAVMFLAGLGMIACYVGFFAIFGLLFLAIPLMVDREMATGDAISASWNTTKTNFWLYVLFAFVIQLLYGAGAVVCYVGLLATMSFLPIAMAVAYERTYNNPRKFAPPVISGGYMPPPYAPGDTKPFPPVDAPPPGETPPPPPPSA